MTANTLSISLSNRNAPGARSAEVVGSLQEAAICVIADGVQTRAEVQVELGVSQSTAGRILVDLVSSGRAMRVGSGRRTRFVCHSPDIGFWHPVGDACCLGWRAFCRTGGHGAYCLVLVLYSMPKGSGPYVLERYEDPGADRL